jgi:uncharacterized protein (TIRG00374 family)
MKKGHLQLILAILISIGLLSFLLWRIGVRSTFHEVSQIKPLYLLFAIALTPLSFTLRTFRWKLIVESCNDTDPLIPFSNFLRLNLYGVYGGAITPGKIGDVLRAVYLSKEKSRVSLGVSFFSVVFDRLLDILAIICIAVFSLMLISINLDSFVLLIVFLFALFVVGGVLFVMSERLSRPVWEKLIDIACKRISILNQSRDGLNASIDDFYKAVGRIRKNSKTLVLAFSIAFITWTIFYIQAFLLLRGLNVNDVPFFVIVFAFALGSLAVLIPVTFGGLGTRDATVYLILSQFDVSGESSLAATITLALIAIWILAIIGGILLGLRLKVQPNEKEIENKDATDLSLSN